MKTVTNHKQRSNGHNNKTSISRREKIPHSQNKYEKQPGWQNIFKIRRIEAVLSQNDIILNLDLATYARIIL